MCERFNDVGCRGNEFNLGFIGILCYGRFDMKYRCIE